MPTIEVEREDLESLLGIELPTNFEELNEILSFIKGEIKHVDDREIHIDVKDSNRADIWSVEGIARTLKGILNMERGLKQYEVIGGSGVEVAVDSRLKNIRPYIACAVVKGVRLSDAAIRHIMRFQDKMDQTYGRGRRRTSIGLYDFDLVMPPLRYTVSRPDETRFVPLGFDEELTLDEILEKHPKGVEYGHIVKQFDVWPIFIDSRSKVLSFPPIINSNDLGKVTIGTRNILVEVTGSSFKTVMYTLTNIILALADRGGKIYSARIHYPYENLGEVITPDLKTEKMHISLNYVRKIVGISLSLNEVIDLLERSRYGVSEIAGDEIVVEIPCYRSDIMHPIDIVEDIAIAYDLNRMKPRWPQISTVGGLSRKTQLRNLIRELMVGLGYQEVLTFTLTNPDILFDKMNISPKKVVEVANPKVSSMTCLRNWLLPSLMEFLSHNTHVEYPQRIFEVGYCVIHDETQPNKTRDIEKIACVTIHSEAGFSEIKSVLSVLLSNLGLKYDLEEVNHGSFIEGRVGKIIVEGMEAGLVGEIHPQVLQNWNLENPAAALEIDLNEIWRLLK
ncbi:MAG: phenylalanine--tRNA ligase subunit beta [Candidatus Bathyarchaeia archaeon]|nr:phenylalanine--tRNA ligase subunit beta [Candidatus Bathyarchaeota archaeon]